MNKTQDAIIARGPSAYEFLRLLVKGGQIVSSGECSGLEIAQAQACRRFWVDNDGFGYIYFPPQPKEGK